jgi:hypothetical protein
LDALVVGITSRRVNFIFDADVASFFDSVSKDWLVRFVEHRIGDLRIIRLIQKWLKAGALSGRSCPRVPQPPPPTRDRDCAYKKIEACSCDRAPNTWVFQPAARRCVAARPGVW